MSVVQANLIGTCGENLVLIGSRDTILLFSFDLYSIFFSY